MVTDVWWAYVMGYGFSILGGHVFIKRVVRQMHRGLGTQGRPHKWHGAAVGFLERAMYTASWHVGAPEFIAVWLGLKVAGRWEVWRSGLEGEESRVPGRSIYNVFLIGSGLSILYASVGALAPEWLPDERWVDWIGVSSALLLGTLLLWLYARLKAPSVTPE